VKLLTHLQIGATQHEVDFVDIDIRNDTPLFIDPHFLALRSDAWSRDATKSIRSFFRHFLTLVRAGNQTMALELFLSLREPNETRLGLSKGRSQGRGVGRDNAIKIFHSLLKSKAVQTGLVEDIEDCRLFVEGIDKDKTSDMTTNIIRRQLIAYTQRQCRLWGIPLTPGVPSGKLWNRAERKWEETHTDMLVVKGHKLLLVPKGVVAYSLSYTPQCYHQHFVLNYLQSYHLSINSALVRERRAKQGRARVRYVTKKSIKETEAPFSKEYLTTFTQSHPEVFQGFKESQRTQTTPLENHELTQESVESVIDRLIIAIREIEPGNDAAGLYHRTIAAALELIFYPRLVSPEIEREINDGRKRIDLVFDNAAATGFFQRLHTTYQTPCQFIMIECKNYGREIGNPELDQMIGRLDPNRGKFGMIVCRSLHDEALFLRRCADSYKSQHGIIIPITDSDVINMLTEMRAGRSHPEEELLARRFREVALR
jgi:hypothetical protein